MVDVVPLGVPLRCFGEVVLLAPDLVDEDGDASLELLGVEVSSELPFSIPSLYLGSCSPRFSYSSRTDSPGVYCLRVPFMLRSGRFSGFTLSLGTDAVAGTVDVISE